MCGCLCVLCLCVYALRIVSMDMILRFMKTLIMINYYDYRVLVLYRPASSERHAE